MIEQNVFSSAEHEQQIKDFTLYANFIANQFNIQVILDTNHAHTNGNIVCLPNVANLSSDELNAMYAILLHEAGHIRHSDFSDTYFKHFKTQLHSFFANCFEDARIENILCTEFDGAKNIFEQLYTVHAINPAINYRLFGFHKRNGDVAFAFGAFLHNIKCNFSTADIIDIDPEAQNMVKFLQKNMTIVEQIQNHPLKTPNDTLLLADIAYDFFISKFKDITPQISFKKDEAVLAQVSEKLDDLSNRASVVEKKLNDALAERKLHEKNYNEAISSVADTLANLKASQSSLSNALNPINAFQRAEEKAKTEITKINNSINSNLNTKVMRDKILNSIENRYNSIQKAQTKIPDEKKFTTNPSFDDLKLMLENGNENIQFNTPATASENVDESINSNLARIQNLIKEYHKKNQVIKNRENSIISNEKNFKEQLNNMKNDLHDAKKVSPLIPSNFKNDFQNQINEMEEKIEAFENYNLEAVEKAIIEQVKENLNNNPIDNSSENNEDFSSADDQLSADEIESLSQEAGGANSSQNQGQNSSESGNGQEEGQGQGQKGSESGNGAPSCISQMAQYASEVSDKINTLEAPFAELKQKMKNARAQVNNVQEKLNKELINSFHEIMNAQQAHENGGYASQAPIQNPLDMLFEDTPGWENADDYQKSFDELATKETGKLTVNGQKIAGSGAGNRSVSVLLNTIKNDVQNINLADCFRETLAGSLMEQHNDAGFENFGAEKGRSINSDSYIAKLSNITKHIVLSTEYDKIEMLNFVESKENEAKKMLNERSDIVNRLSAEMKKKMKVTKKPRFVGAKDEGDLDSRNLWKIPARRGSDVFEQNNPKFVNNVVASIVVDISGSLNNDSTKEGKELKFVTAALSNALQDCYVNHEVLGYHAPYSTELADLKSDESYNRRNHYLETVVFKNFKQKDNSGIDNLEIQSSDNSDGESLRIAMKRILQQRSRNRILFMVTDAKPFLTGSNVLKLDKDLYEALQEAKRKKIQVIGVGFNADKTGIFGSNFIQIKNNTYEELIDGIKNLDLKAL